MTSSSDGYPIESTAAREAVSASRAAAGRGHSSGPTSRSDSGTPSEKCPFGGGLSRIRAREGSPDSMNSTLQIVTNRDTDGANHAIGEIANSASYVFSIRVESSTPPPASIG